MANVIEIVIKASDNASSKITGLVNGFKSIGALAVAKKVAEIGYELGTLGAQALRTEAAFARVVGGSREAAALLEDLKAASFGTRSEMELMENATNLIALGFGKSSEQLGSITRNVESLGARFGGTMQIFQLMMANKSLMRIDSFGIGVQEATQRINEFKAAGMEADQAFDTAILELMNEKYELLGGAVDDAVAANQRLAASWADLKAEVGKGLAPVVDTVVSALAEAAKNANALVGMGGTVNTMLQDDTAAALEAGDAWEDYARQQIMAQIRTGRQQKMLNELNAQLRANGEEVRIDSTNSDSHNYVIEESIRLGIGYGETLSREEYELQRATVAQEQATKALEEQRLATFRANIAGQDSLKTWNQYDRAMQEVAESSDRAAQNTVRIREETAALNLARATDEWNMVRTAMDGAIGREAQDYIQNVGALRDEMTGVRGAVFDLRVEQDKLPEGTKRYIEITQEIAGLESKYDGLIGKLQELNAQHVENNRAALIGMVEQRMALDGLSADEQDALSQLAADWGLIDEATLAALQGTAEIVTKFGEGALKGEDLAGALDDLINSADPAADALANAAGVADDASVNMSDAAQAARDLRDALDGIEDKSITIQVDWEVPDAPVITTGGGQTIQMMQHGFEGWFSRPTLALFGEAGPEYVSAVPKSQMTNSNNTVNNGGDTIIINNNAQAGLLMDTRRRNMALAGRF